MAMSTSEIDQVITLIDRSKQDVSCEIRQLETKVRTLYALLFVVTAAMIAMILIVANAI